MCIWEVSECYILEMKKFTNCLKMKKEPLHSPFLLLIIHPFSFYRFAHMQTWK